MIKNYTVVCNICLNLFIKISIVLFVIFPSLSMSQNGTTKISREALFDRAFKSLSFVLKVAGHNRLFMQSLTPEEHQMLNQIYPLVSEVTTLNWLETNQFTKNTKDGIDFYSYVLVKDNQPAHITTPVGTNVKVRYLNNSKLFKLSPEEPPRDAITANDMSSDILINLHNINLPDRNVTLGDAFSIFVHEFGRKIEGPVFQGSIDSLAAKLKSFIDMRTEITELQNSRVIVIKFSKLPFNEWFEPITFGLFKGVNIPFEYRPFEALDTQGTFVIVETNQYFHDITDQLFKKESDRPIVSFTQDNFYKWAILNWYSSDYIEIMSKNDNQFELNMNVNQSQFVVPFWKPESPNPKIYQPYLRTMKMHPHGNQTYHSRYKIDLSKNRPDVTHLHYDILKNEAPQYAGKLVKKIWMKDDLILKYEISGEKIINTEDVRFEFWPKLVLFHNNNRIEITASSKEENTNIYSFRLENIRYASSGKLQILGLELSSKKPDLTSPMPDTTIIGSLESIQDIELEGQNNLESTVLKSIQGWDGQKWLTLNSRPNIQTQSLRLVFQSKVKIKKLSLLQRIDRSISFSTLINNIKGEGEPIIQSSYVWVRFEEHELHQSIVNGVLFVDVLIDKDYQTIDNVTYPIQYEAESESALPEYVKKMNTVMPNIVESMAVSTEGTRQIIKTSIVTESLQAYEITFSKPLLILKNKSVLTKGSNNSKKIQTCRAIVSKTN